MCQHVALILDGNRRWGKQNKLSLALAYKKGAEKLQEIVLELINLQVPFSTIYGFSFENWNRSLYEIAVVITSFMTFLKIHKNFFIENKIKVTFIGDLSFFDNQIIAQMLELEEITQNYSAIFVQLAVSYSGRNEILLASSLAQKNAQNFEKYLYTSDIPDPDLLIRTGGSYRLSNFLLWQLAYTELFFIDTLWPDFEKKELHQILNKYKQVKQNHGT